MTDWDIGARLLEVLPVNVGLTHEELPAKLGGGLPYKTLEALWDANIADQYVKKPGDPIRWRWRVELKGKHDMLTAQALHVLCRDQDPWTDQEAAAAWGAQIFHMCWALARAQARGWSELDPASPAEWNRVHRATPFGREAQRVEEALNDLLPPAVTGEGMSLAEIMAKAGCDERAARSALEMLGLFTLLLKAPAGPGGEERWCGDWDPADAVYEKVETWDQKRAKQTN